MEWREGGLIENRRIDEFVEHLTPKICHKYGILMSIKILSFFAILLFVYGCTEESRNKLFRSVQQNVLGERLRVSYVDHGIVVKTWIINDGKVTSGKDENSGRPLGYYYFYSETGYVQLPIEKTIIEELWFDIQHLNGF